MSKTNVELVTEIMEYSAFGGLTQAFVIQALDAYCTAVIKQGKTAYDSPFMNGESWVGIAEEVKAKITNRE